MLHCYLSTYSIVTGQWFTAIGEDEDENEDKNIFLKLYNEAYKFSAIICGLYSLKFWQQDTPYVSSWTRMCVHLYIQQGINKWWGGETKLYQQSRHWICHKQWRIHTSNVPWTKTWIIKQDIEFRKLMNDINRRRHSTWKGIIAQKKNRTRCRCIDPSKNNSYANSIIIMFISNSFEFWAHQNWNEHSNIAWITERDKILAIEY